MKSTDSEHFNWPSANSVKVYVPAVLTASEDKRSVISDGPASTMCEMSSDATDPSGRLTSDLNITADLALALAANRQPSDSTDGIARTGQTRRISISLTLIVATGLGKVGN